MDEHGHGVAEIYVKPGESHLVEEPAIFKTLLGSCVGVTFRVRRKGVGALCHPMLPICPTHSPVASGCRYVDYAIRELAGQFDALQIERSEVEVKLFGGADVLGSGGFTLPTIGKQNSAAATRVLEEEGFHWVASRLGGNEGIHITFDTRSGEVLVRRLGQLQEGPGKRARRGEGG